MVLLLFNRQYVLNANPLHSDQRALPDSLCEDIRNGSDPISIQIIQSWINRCTSSHTYCRGGYIERSGHSFARILDVGSFEDAPQVRLRLAKDLPESIRYTTLSHCWGGSESKIPSLMTSNYDEYCKGIGIAGLPRTFKDAIYLTRRLGIEFLWIDSLCIIQNSRDDWLEQAAIMGDVYHGSYLNVAATRSKDPNGGLFGQRDPFVLTPLRLGISESTAQLKASSQHGKRDNRWYALKDTSTLMVLTPAHPLEYTQKRFDLNEFLGNSDGKFCPHGVNFALSAINIRLHDDNLHAELRTISGEWKHDVIDLNQLTGVRDEMRGIWRSFWLEGSSMLVLKSPAADAADDEIHVNLNNYVGNEDGKFTRQGKNFETSARDISISGRTLSAELQGLNGEWHQDSLDVSTLVHDLEAAGKPKLEDNSSVAITFYDVGTDCYTQWSSDVTRSPLCNRGWVIQERLLAPRVVHFAQRQLYFECAESRSVEQSPGLEIDCRQPLARNTRLDFKAWDVFSPDLIVAPEPRRLGVNYVWSSVKAMFGRGNVDFRKEDLALDESIFLQALRMCYGEDLWIPTHPLIKYWSAILTTYSSARLTYEEDRLLAIAGLAKILSQRSGIRYVAGLWLEQLPRQLLWKHHSRLNDSDITQSSDETLYIAPSWSPTSCKALLGGRGILLDPVLESKGAMDLIKVIDYDVKGSLAQDDPPFGRVVRGHLRLRGRLLPVSLDLSKWPEGEDRPRHLLQHWAGAAKQPPVGETFLVPVLFSRWNERLSSATANSLLLESTEDAGVFRRIGLARLSSRYPLKDIVPQLYSAWSSHYEDEDDDANSEGEALPEDLIPAQTASTSQPIPPNPQQELANTRMELIGSSFISGGLEALQKRTTDRLTSSAGPAANAKTLETALKGISHLQAGIRAVRSDFSGKPAQKMQINAQEIQDSMNREGHNVTVATRNHPWDRKRITTLTPKAAVGEHFYLRYEDDEDASRYGHFVFDVI